MNETLTTNTESTSPEAMTSSSHITTATTITINGQENTSNGEGGTSILDYATTEGTTTISQAISNRIFSYQIEMITMHIMHIDNMN